MMSSKISAMLTKYALRAKSFSEKEMQARLDRVDASRPYVDSVRELLVDSGLTPAQAYRLALVDATSHDAYGQALHGLAGS